jgi:hypothetical protein
MRTLTEDNLRHLISGATILGTGGGGDPSPGLKTLLSDLKSGRRFELVKTDELNPRSIVASAYYCGSIRAPSRKEKKSKKPGVKQETCMHLALETLERRLQRRISAIIPTELGGGNTATALHLASISRLPVVDADQTGRSAPELIHYSYQIHEIPATPSIVVDELGDVIVVDKYRDAAHYEKIVRSFAVLAGGSTFVIDSPVEAREVPRIAIMNSISRAMDLGKSIEKAREKNRNPVQAALEFLGGFQLFYGYVQDFELLESEGFLIGDIRFKGVGDWRDHSFRIWVKNENIIEWRDNRVVAMAPDLICVLDEKGRGITNSQLRRGMKVSVIGVRAERIWRTARGIKLFGPRHFGFDFDYVPIEKCLK